MKKLITLGIALLATASTMQAETTLVKGVHASNTIVAAVKAQQFENLLLANVPVEGKFAPVEDKTVLIPETVLVKSETPIEDIIAEDNKIIEGVITDEGYLFFVFEKQPEEIIMQDNQIIESEPLTEVRPLYLERTIEDVIAQDNAIIEGMPVQVMDLDFDRINRESVVAEN